MLRTLTGVQTAQKKNDEHVTFHFLFILRWIIDQFYKEKLEDGKIVRVTAEFTFKSKNTVVLNERQVKQALKEQQEYILGKIEAFINMESDWHIDKILASFINVVRYSAARGSSYSTLYIDLPQYLKLKGLVLT